MTEGKAFLLTCLRASHRQAGELAHVTEGYLSACNAQAERKTKEEYVNDKLKETVIIGVFRRTNTHLAKVLRLSLF